MKSKIIGRFDYGRCCGLEFPADKPESRSRTKQAFKSVVNINSIMKKYARTGILVDPARVSNRQAFFADVSGLGDYQDAQNLILEAGRNFMTLPAVVRKRFDNDPAELLDFLRNPDNLREAQELGILKAPEPERDGLGNPPAVPPGASAPDAPSV